ncbi:ShET2/EspL2 family type III secretion system effector toxin [Ralstonia pseudosolanacearum]
MKTAVEDMSTLSNHRVKRWFRKSASEQYLYAKRLLPQQRDALEEQLVQKMRGNTPEAREALTMWMSVQQARLRMHSPLQQQAYRSQQAANAILGGTVIGAAISVPALRRTRAQYYHSSDRPEYEKAFNNFMSVIVDSSLGPEIRTAVIERLDYHAWSEGTIAPQEMQLLHEQGAETLANSGYRAESPLTFQSASRRPAPPPTKAEPYFSPKRAMTDLNLSILLKNGDARLDPGGDYLACRHLALAYCLASDDNGGKFDFDKLSISGNRHYDNFQDKAWRDKYVQPTVLAWGGLGPDSQSTVVDGSRFGAVLANVFKRLEATGQDHASAVIHTANFGDGAAAAFTGHTMAVAIRIKTDPVDGRRIYVANVYDPNRTLTHKRVRVTDLQSLEHLAFDDFLDAGVTYGKPTVLGMLSKSMPLDLSRETTQSGDATLKARIGLALWDDVPQELHAVAEQLRGGGSAHLQDDELIDLLAAKDASGHPALHFAIYHGSAEAMKAYGQLLAQAGLDHDTQVSLLAAKDQFGVPAFNNAMSVRYNWDVVESFAEMVLDADLPDEARAKVLEGKDSSGVSSLLQAVRCGNADGVGLFVMKIRHSALPDETKTQLLAAKSAEGTPALAVAMERGDSYSMMRFVKQVLHSSLPDEMKVELVAGKRADGVSAVERAGQAGHQALVALYGDLVRQSHLPKTMQAELLAGSNPRA